MHIKAFYGTTDDAVRIQVWIAISFYVLVAIVSKELGVERQAQRNLANSQPDAIRENPYFSGIERLKTTGSGTTFL